MFHAYKLGFIFIVINYDSRCVFIDSCIFNFLLKFTSSPLNQRNPAGFRNINNFWTSISLVFYGSYVHNPPPFTILPTFCAKSGFACFHSTHISSVRIFVCNIEKGWILMLLLGRIITSSLLCHTNQQNQNTQPSCAAGCSQNVHQNAQNSSHVRASTANTRKQRYPK